MENYIYYTTMEDRAQIKVDVVPHKFSCQPNRKQQGNTTLRPAAEKRRKQQTIQEILSESSKTVTDVSRSGRVRKKSLKLIDFESPHNSVENKLKKQRKAQQLPAQPVPESLDDQQAQVAANVEMDNQNQRRNSKDFELHDNPPIIKVEIKTESEDQILGYESNVIDKDEDSYFVAVNIKEEVDPLLIDEREMNFSRLEPPNQEIPLQLNNLYSVEKSRKKSTIKNKKVNKPTKTQRSDKGKTRVTSYMLWARDVRQELLKKCPNMDFATISKKLAELWATVSQLEKYNLRRRAKRANSK